MFPSGTWMGGTTPLGKPISCLKADQLESPTFPEYGGRIWGVGP